MTTPQEPAPEAEEESAEFNLADYEIEESEEETLPEPVEKEEEKPAPSLDEVRAMLRESAKETKKQQAKEAPSPALQEEPMQKISPMELNLTLSVEAGSIQIPYEKLLELKAGSLLEIGLSPEQGVNLMVNGQCIGKGELVKIGDAIGVRILEI